MRDEVQAFIAKDDLTGEDQVLSAALGDVVLVADPNFLLQDQDGWLKILQDAATVLPDDDSAGHSDIMVLRALAYLQADARLRIQQIQKAAALLEQVVEESDQLGRPAHRARKTCSGRCYGSRRSKASRSGCSARLMFSRRLKRRMTVTSLMTRRSRDFSFGYVSGRTSRWRWRSASGADPPKTTLEPMSLASSEGAF
jgi:hypothetical protein